jgi:hypothetical protein
MGTRLSVEALRVAQSDLNANWREDGRWWRLGIDGFSRKRAPGRNRGKVLMWGKSGREGELFGRRGVECGCRRNLEFKSQNPEVRSRKSEFAASFFDMSRLEFLEPEPRSRNVGAELAGPTVPPSVLVHS